LDCFQSDKEIGHAKHDNGREKKRPLTVAAVMIISFAPTVFNILARTNMRAATTTVVNPQKKPLIARIEAAFVVVSGVVITGTVSALRPKCISIQLRETCSE